MKTFVFVGSNVSDMMGVVSFRRFGQRAVLTDEQARDLATGGAAIAPADRFDAIAIPEKLLRQYAEFGTHGQASAEFLGYKKLAIAAYEEFRASLETSVAVEEEV